MTELKIVYVNLNSVNPELEKKINSFVDLYFPGFREDNPLCDNALLIEENKTGSIVSMLFYQNHTQKTGNQKKYTFFAALAVTEVRRKQKIGFQTVYALLLYVIERGDCKLGFCTDQEGLGFYKKVSDVLKIKLYYRGGHSDESVFYFDLEKADLKKVKQRGISYLNNNSFMNVLRKRLKRFF